MGASVTHLFLFSLFITGYYTQSHYTTSACGVNINTLLKKAGCKTFASLIHSTGVLKTLEEGKGVTIFAPTDEAFNPKLIGALAKLPRFYKTLLLKYHALPSFKSFDELKGTMKRVRTLASASNKTTRYELRITGHGDEVYLETGLVKTKIESVVIDSRPLSIFTIPSVLLPKEQIYWKIPPPPLPPTCKGNIPSLLEKAGCKTFVKLITATRVLEVYQMAADKKGLTIFAPSEKAFNAKNLPDLANLTTSQKVSLLEYHALPSYMPIAKLKDTKKPISTLATTPIEKYQLVVKSVGHKIILKTGADSSKIVNTVFNSKPITIFTIDNVLLPIELVGKAPSPPTCKGNIATLLEKAGCKTFVELITATRVLEVYQRVADNEGLTIFAPSEEAFKAKNLPDLAKLTTTQKVSLLEYHALPSFMPITKLKDTKEPITTLATTATEKYQLVVKSVGHKIILKTGVDSSNIVHTVFNSQPVSIFTIDTVLLPIELVGEAPSPSPMPWPSFSLF